MSEQNKSRLKSTEPKQDIGIVRGAYGCDQFNNEGENVRHNQCQHGRRTTQTISAAPRTALGGDRWRKIACSLSLFQITQRLDLAPQVGTRMQPLKNGRQFFGCG